MPDSPRFRDYTETGQVIPVRFKGEDGVYVHSMYLDDDAPIAGGRELWGFPKKLARPKIEVESDVLVARCLMAPGSAAAAPWASSTAMASTAASGKGWRGRNLILRSI